MKMYNLTICLCLLITFANAQESSHRDLRQTTDVFNPNSSSRGIVEEYNLREKVTTIETVFLDEEWLNVELYLKGAKVGKKVPLKYDILNQEILINITNTPMTLPKNKLDSFVFYNRYGTFVSMDCVDDKKENSIYELVENGSAFKLLVRRYIKIMKPDYNAAIGIGSHDAKTIEKKEYYLLDGDKLLAIPKKKKAFNQFFQRYSAAKAYLSKNNVSVKREEDLTLLIRNLNN